MSDRKRESSWKDIFFIDGDALVIWLEDHPAVSAWHARNTLQLYAKDGLRSTDEFWSDFTGQFGPQLTEEVLLCERAEAATNLVAELMKAANTVQLVADSPDEAVAFAVAAIRKAQADVRLFLEARTLVIDSAVAGRQLMPRGNLILLLRNDATRSPKQFLSMGTTFVPLGRQQRGGTVSTLTRPTAHAMGVAMQTMGLEENRALTLARGSGRSLTALARLIPGGSYEPPAWQQKGEELLPAILAGAWDSSNDKDREIIELLSDRSTASEVERRARNRLQDADPPFDLEGSIWKVRAPMDAFVRVGPLIGHDEAMRLRAASLKVFAEIVPEPDPDDIVSFRSTKPTIYSGWLREGLATTLLLLAVWSKVAEVNLGLETGQAFANRTLGELPGLRSDARLLTSLRNELPLLAEAAPDPLLSALEHMLEGNAIAIRPIFDERPGLMHPRSEHTGVLWALEVLAWDPEYFRRAVLVLARLAAIDPGGTLANRPANSLAEIFVLWNPHTNASFEQRLAAFDEIASTCPEVGWKLLLELLPSNHEVSSPTAKPKLREAGAAERKSVTYGELWSNQAIVCEKATLLAAHDPKRWSDLIQKLASFPPTERERALAAIEDTLRVVEAPDRQALWARIRDEVFRHERFKDAGWSLSEQELGPFKRLIELYAPADPVALIRPLFDNWSIDADGSQRRIAALKQLYSEAGADAVIRLGTETKFPYSVVEAVTGAGFSNSEIAEFLSLSFDRDPEAGFTFGMSALYRRVAGEEHASSWLRHRVDQGKATPRVAALLLQSWPDNRGTWAIVRRFGKEVVDIYWSQGRPRYLKDGPRSDLFRSILMMLRYGRAIEAIETSLDRLAELPTKLLRRMLDGVIPELNAGTRASDTMVSYELEKVLGQLDTRDDVSEGEVAMREYQLFPLIGHGDRKLRIYSAMAKDAALFHQILRNVYIANDEEKTEVDDSVKATALRSYRLLSGFKLLPGQENGGVDAIALSKWIDETRRLGVETKRPEVTESHLGRVLAHAPPDADGTWPHKAVRAEIERLASSDIERAVQIERYNMRGVHGRGIYEGGHQERQLAKVAFDAAETMAQWPRTAALLRAIGRTWEEDAARADLDAAQRRLRS